jgi:hypothetical protein
LNRFYVVSPYHPDTDGDFIPDIPSHGPCRERDGRECKLCIDHFRERKQGPGPNLCVMRCGTHKKGFTIYPPGWVPYGRKALAPVALDGGAISNGDGARRFAGTCFDAALDAADRRAWPRQSDSGSVDPRFSTQTRHLRRSSLLLGIHPSFDQRVREQTAQILDVPGQLLCDAAALIERQPGYHGSGRACRDILESIPASNSIFESLAEAGAVVRLWPSPRLWDRRRGGLRRTVFRGIETPVEPG